MDHRGNVTQGTSDVGSNTRPVHAQLAHVVISGSSPRNIRILADVYGIECSPPKLVTGDAQYRFRLIRFTCSPIPFNRYSGSVLLLTALWGPQWGSSLILTYPALG
jgi:hypothetical protein